MERDFAHLRKISLRSRRILKYMLTSPTPLSFKDGVLRREDGEPFFENI